MSNKIYNSFNGIFNAKPEIKKVVEPKPVDTLKKDFKESTPTEPTKTNEPIKSVEPKKAKKEKTPKPQTK